MSTKSTNTVNTANQAVPSAEDLALEQAEMEAAAVDGAGSTEASDDDEGAAPASQTDETKAKTDKKESTGRTNAEKTKSGAKKVSPYGEDVKIRVAKSELNPGDDMIPVCINGKEWKIKRGVTVVVPEAVKDILETAGYL